MEKERIDREELQSLISRARKDRDGTINHEWVMAYNQLILACSTLDAFIARSSVPSYMTQDQPLEIGTECGWSKSETDMGGTIEPICTAPDCDCDKKSGCQNS